MPWQREAEFKDVLEKAVKKGSKGAIATAQNIAIQDMGQCYKHVCALVERQMRKAKADQRLNALYIISTICRHSLKKHKLQDKYTGRWSPSIAGLVELVADLPASQMAQVKKVLASWKREKIFQPAIVDQCAINAGITLSQTAPSGLASLPPGGAGAPLDIDGDANEIAIPSPAMSVFSEASAGSVDLAALEESFPPKPVASANINAPSKVADQTIIPASNASTGSSRPPDLPRPPPADLYDPFAAESYDYDPFGSDSAPAESPHRLPPLPSIKPTPKAEPNAKQAAAVGSAATGTVGIATNAEPSGLADGAQADGRAGGSTPLPSVQSLPPPSLPAQPTPASRKRKSRWEEAAPEGADTGTELASAGARGMPDAAPHAVPAEPAVAVQPKQRRSRFSDAPPGPAAVLPLPGQGTGQPIPPADASAPSIPKPTPPAPEAETPSLLKPASARQDGEAQAAAALQAVEQMLQAKRHSDARSIAPSTSRPKQPPLPAHQPPLPRPPPPQPPLPQMPPPQPAFTDAMDPGQTSGQASSGPAWHAPYAAHAVPSFSPRPPPPFPGQQPGFPHMPTVLQQGVQRPHLGQFAPQQFVQAGLQQHHRPAPLHHFPSMMQNQPRPPPPQYVPPPHAGWPPPQHPTPPSQLRPQRQGISGMDRQGSLGRGLQQPAKPIASPCARQMPSESDLGHFQTSSVAMDTPTDTGATLAWKRAAPEGSGRGPGPLTGAPTVNQIKGSEDANAIAIGSAEDDSVPMPPPSPPPPPTLSEPGAGTSTAPFPDLSNASGGNATSSQFHSSTPSGQDAAAAAVISAPVAEAMPPQAAALGNDTVLSITSQAAAAVAATSQATNAALDVSPSPSTEAAHAAAPAGPAEPVHDQQKGTSKTNRDPTAEPTRIVRDADEEMEMSD